MSEKVSQAPSCCLTKSDSINSRFSIRKVYLSQPGVAFSLLWYSAPWITDTSRSTRAHTQFIHTIKCIILCKHNSCTQKYSQVPCPPECSPFFPLCLCAILYIQNVFTVWVPTLSQRRRRIEALHRPAMENKSLPFKRSTPVTLWSDELHWAQFREVKCADCLSCGPHWNALQRCRQNIIDHLWSDFSRLPLLQFGTLIMTVW